MRILLVVCSPSLDGNTREYARRFFSIAEAHSHVVRFVEGVEVLPCCGCKICGSIDCIQEDHYPRNLDKYDAVVFATPVYFFNFPAQAKACIDRLYGMSPQNKVISLMIFSGSSFKESGSKILIKSMKLSAKYCGFKFGGYFHKQTNDKKPDVSMDDLYKLADFLDKIEKEVKLLET